MNKSNDQLDTLAIYPLIPFAIEKPLTRTIRHKLA